MAVVDMDTLDVAIDATVHSRNAQVRHHGRGPFQIVFGRVPRVPCELLTSPVALIEDGEYLGERLVRSRALGRGDEGLR